MRAVRLLYPLRQVAASPLPPVAFFSGAVIDTKSTNCAATDANTESPVRRNRPKFKWNSASFVGTVEQPLRVNTRNGKTLSAWTFLRAKVSPDSNSSFRVFLKLWEEMAESNLERLKPNDFIYVAGTLESYKKDNKCGKSYLCYELTVSELNYIKQYDQGSKSQNDEGVRHEEGDPRKKYRERLHLWQVFFGSPYEWWDNRNHKSNSKHPDFRHKSTGEALWLQATDPPWIRKQLEFLDGKMEEKDQHCHFGSDSSMSKWLYS
ncbi:protein OSB1, mitochondrial-like [Momordica charantia]|uniref:Protein OSB1, mitochondrial-like n=1 Tax=Momordica charantia TaxID=3673 RepID=A0A6J1CSS2_MOMCH|nr:protein OSB1, mitochondrial-like [Momordica charantia]